LTLVATIGVHVVLHLYSSLYLTEISKNGPLAIYIGKACHMMAMGTPSPARRGTA
jgi:hypothetical protein